MVQGFGGVTGVRVQAGEVEAGDEVAGFLAPFAERYQTLEECLGSLVV